MSSGPREISGSPERTIFRGLISPVREMKGPPPGVSVRTVKRFPSGEKLDRIVAAGLVVAGELQVWFGNTVPGPRGVAALLMLLMTAPVAVRRRPSAVLLDCGEVEEVDSAGLGELVILYTAAGQHHCRLVLVSPSLRLRRLLETTRLSGLLPQFADVQAAQAWIQRP